MENRNMAARLAGLLTRGLALCALGVLGVGAVHAGETATVYRDHYGMPHIFSKSEPAGMYALGYATAEDRLLAVLRNYKQSRGEMAEIDGEKALSEDQQVRAFCLAEKAEQRYSTISQQVRDDLDAYCRGFNQYRKDNPDKSPAWAWDIKPIDVVTFAAFVNLSFARDNSQQMPSAPKAALADMEKQIEARELGSNGFALSSVRLSDHKGVIVSADPHLPWDGFLRWYECQLTCGPLNVAGVTFAGLPFVAIGHNDHLAWANTVNSPDLSDVYEEHLRPAGQPKEYEYDGKFLPLEAKTFQFKVKEAGDSPRTVSLTVPYTRHGPVLMHNGGSFYAFRKAAVGEVGMLDQIRRQDLATNCHDYEHALSARQVVMYNHIFGDDKGHVEYVFAGRVPQRPMGYDFHAIVPGWLKATDWGDTTPFKDLPKLLDPATGFLQNCNDAPYHVSPGSELSPAPPKGGYPNWLTPDNTTSRGIRLTELLRQSSNVTAADVQAMATDTLDLDAAANLSEWIKQAKSAETPEADKPLFDRAITVLAGWNMRRLADLPGPPLFEVWKTLIESTGADSPTAAQLSSSLVKAAQMFEKHHAPLDIPLGAVHRLQRGKMDIPLDGGGNSLVPNRGPLSADGKSIATFGSSYQMIVELGRGPLRVWSYSPYGVSDDPASPHFTDQMDLAAHRKFRVVPFTLEEIKADSESAKVLEWSK